MGDYIVQGFIDIMGHAGGITTNAERGALFEPCIQLLGVFSHAVLYINFLGLVAGEGYVELGEHTVAQIALPFGLIKEVG